MKEKFWICYKKKKNLKYRSVYKGYWDSLTGAIYFFDHELPVCKRKIYAVCNESKTEILYSQEEK